MDNPFDDASLSREDEEARVRRALGMGTGRNYKGSLTGGGQHRSFVRDGEVPVTIINRKPEDQRRHEVELAGLRTQLTSEREARLRAERALHEAQASIQSLQTRIAHADMARAEKLPEPEIAPERQPEPEPEVAPAAPVLVKAEPIAPSAPVAKPAAEPVADAEPIEWWTEAYRSGKRR